MMSSVFHAGFEAGQLPTRVRFGAGIRHEVANELTQLALSRALVLTTPGHVSQGEAICTALGASAFALFSRATMHTPVSITEEALAVAIGADCLVAIGGGSAIGLAKAIAYRTGLPQIVLPTTYAGSEATPILGQTADGVKQTIRSPKVQAQVVLYDPELVATLPVALTVTSGLNAMAHAIEGMYARDRSPLSEQLALAGIRGFAEGLAGVVANPGNLAAREKTQFASWLCGTVLAQVGMALHHKLCHTLGGSFDLPHAETHAVVLPHAVAYNARAAAEALAPVDQILGGPAAGALFDLARSLGAPSALRDLGLPESALDRAADLAVENAYWNPRPLTRATIRTLLQQAWSGDRPG